MEVRYVHIGLDDVIGCVSAYGFPSDIFEST